MYRPDMATKKATKAEVQKIADEAAAKVAALSDVEEEVEVTITEVPPGTGETETCAHEITILRGESEPDVNVCAKCGSVLV